MTMSMLYYQPNNVSYNNTINHNIMMENFIRTYTIEYISLKNLFFSWLGQSYHVIAPSDIWV